jgi:hypothetical protein
VIRVALLLTMTTCAGIAQDAAASDGYQSLFSGHDLGAWVGDQQQWTAQGGTLRGISDGKSESALVLTGREYGDFELRLEICVRKGAAGIKVRWARRGPPGIEFEVGSSMARWLVNGSPFLTVANVKAGQWNEYQIICKGPRFNAFRNGISSGLEMVAGHTPPSGKIAILMPEGAPSDIELRNIRLKE